MIITFYKDNRTEKDVAFFQKLFNLGYTPLVDAVHGGNNDFFNHNYLYEKSILFGKKYYFDDYTIGETLIVNTETANVYFSVVFDSEIDNDDRLRIIKIFQAFYNNTELPKFTRSISTLLAKPDNAPDLTEQYKAEKFDDSNSIDVQKEESVNYTFRSRVIDDRNIAFCEIGKPFTDLPYTVVIRDFATRGYKIIFTSIFIATSWGVSHKDLQFLKKLWDFFGFEEEFDLEKMLKEHTEKCLPSDTSVPEPEPIVYRRKMEDVVEIFDQMEQGIYCVDHFKN